VAKKKSVAKKLPSLARKKPVVLKAVGKTTAQKVANKAVKKAVKKVTKKVDSKESLLHSGDNAPPFSAPNEKGEVVSLKSFLGQKLVLYFYPKDDTPGCTQESCDFRDSFSRLKKQGVCVVGVSRDSVKSHLKFKEKYGFLFSLLSDEDGKICEAYGVWKEKNLYGRKYMGIERTTFLIDEKGKITRVYPKVKVAGHVDEILEELKNE
jgi:peroxiredoxin Q/BCP